MQKIILVGYMGVGKTTVSNLLAQKLGFDWVDLDQKIENEENLSIPEIFKQKGEIYFRKKEHQIFKELISNPNSLIISTGGGTPCYANNHLLLNGTGISSFYLRAPIELLFERLKNNRAERPVVAHYSDMELQEFIAKNLFDRSYFYNQATYKIEVINKTPDEVVNEIINALG